MDQYLPIVLLLVVGAAFAGGSFLASKLLGPSRPSSVKSGPYESGIVPRDAASARFPVRFYLVAMIFIIFDIEVVFLYPWATIFGALHTFGLAEMAAFALVVFVSFAYLVSNGALDWGPPKRRGRTAGFDQSRSSMATVRRVRRPGQVIYSTVPTSVDDETDTEADTDTGGGTTGGRTGGGSEPDGAPGIRGDGVPPVPAEAPSGG